MPNPVTEPPAVVLPLRAHAAVWLRCAFGLFAGAAVGAACGSVVVAVALSTVAITPLVCGLALHAVARRQERAVANLLRSASALRWQYAEPQWSQHVASERRTGRFLPWLMVGIGLLIGVAVSAAMYGDGVRIAGSLAWVWVVPTAGGLALGSLVAMLVGSRQRAHLAAMQKAPGVFCADAAGFYLTGSYWSWSSPGLTLRSIARDGKALVFAFRILRGGDHSVRVPIPPGREDEAQRYVDRSNAV